VSACCPRHHCRTLPVHRKHSVAQLCGSSYRQNPVFEAAITFARSEGIVPAPESAHAIKGAIDEALRCKEAGEAKTILIGLSGHGNFDLAAYDAYLAGKLEDYELPEQEIERAMGELPAVAAG
jgi:tryptophan synthase beta chain